MFWKWLQQLTRTQSPARSRGRTSVRPRLEALEHRLIPAVHTWNGLASLTGNPNWSATGNWVGGSTPAGDLSPQLVFPDIALGLGRSSFNDLALSPLISMRVEGGGYNITGNSITLGSVFFPGASITATYATGSSTLAVPISLNFALLATGGVDVTNAGATLTLSNTISGSLTSGLLKRGAGTVVVSGSNTYQGGTSLTAGTLVVGRNTALGAAAGRLTLNGGSIQSNGAFTVANPFTVASNLSSFRGGSNLTFTGPGTLNLPLRTANTAGSILSFAGALTGGAQSGILANGTGTVILSGTCNVGGQTLVEAGTLDVRGALSSSGGVFINNSLVHINAAGSVSTFTYTQSGTSRTRLADGGIIASSGVFLNGGLLDGSGYVVGDLRNNARIDVGGIGAVGYVFVVGNYTQTAAGTLNVDLAGPEFLTQYDLLYVTGTASLAGTLNVSRLNGYLPAPGDFFFPVFSGGLTSGTFTTISGLPLGGGRELLPIYFANGLLLFAT